jgi:hypothetical protein
LIKRTRDEAQQLLKSDPNLAQYPELKTRLARMQKIVHFE